MNEHPPLLFNTPHSLESYYVYVKEKGGVVTNG